MGVLSIILPVFAALGLGIIARRYRILSCEGVLAIKHVAVNITLPAVTLGAFAEAEYSGKTVLVAIWIFVCCCIALCLGFAACRLTKTSSRLFPYLCTGFEGGMLGFSLYALLSDSLAAFAIVDMGQIIFIFSVYKALLSGAKGARALVRETVQSPSLWALLIGLLIGATGLYEAMAASGMQSVFDNLLDFIAAPTSFLILLSVGYDLRLQDIDWSKTALALVSRTLILGLLLGVTLLLNHFVLGDFMDVTATILMFALPAPFVLPVFADSEDERGFMSSSLSAMTLLTLAVFGGMALWLG